MDSLVIEGKKKGDFEILIALAKRLGLKVHFIQDEIIEEPNKETIKALNDVAEGKVFKSKSHKDLMEQLGK